MTSRLLPYLDYFKTLETPFYFYDLSLLEATLQAAQKAAQTYGYHLHYALKANADGRLLHMIKQHGFGADCVSGFEVKKALDSDFAPETIFFAGVGKTDKEIVWALENQIGCLNVESLPELEVIQSLALKMNVKAKVALRLNPNVNAKTHHYITTGLEENKFGINTWEFDALFQLLPRLSHLQLIGLHFHIGSQIMDLQVFSNLCLRVNELNQLFIQKGYTVKHLNLGGGLGVDYSLPDEHAISNFEAYFGKVHQFLEPFPGQEIHFEPGRCLVAQCGSLIARVVYLKKGNHTDFLILDAGMTECIRPALYQAYHKIENLSATSDYLTYYDVVGPVCESSDCFGKRIALPYSQRGDIIAIRSTGAYGITMASQYNLRPIPPAYFSHNFRLSG